MSEPNKLRRLPRWPPSALLDVTVTSVAAAAESKNRGNGGGATGLRSTAPPAGEAPGCPSVFAGPIFGGECWDALEAEEGYYDGDAEEEPCTIASPVGHEHGGSGGGGGGGGEERERRDFVGSAGTRSDRGAGAHDRIGGGSATTRKTALPRDALADRSNLWNLSPEKLPRCPATGNNPARVKATPTRVRFSLGSPTAARTAAAAGASPPPPPGRGRERAAIGAPHANASAAAAAAAAAATGGAALNREEGEGDAYASAEGQRIVRQRNGMHTAWRVRAGCVNGDGDGSPTPRPPPPPPPPLDTASAGSEAAHRSSSEVNTVVAPKSLRWGRSTSADQLISLTTRLPPQQEQRQSPVRLFLRRTSPGLPTATPPAATGGAAANARDAGAVATAAAYPTVKNKQGAGAAGVSPGSRRPRRDGVGSGDSRAFPPAWAAASGGGAFQAEIVRLGRRGGTGAAGRCTGGGLLEVMTTPPPPPPPRRVDSTTTTTTTTLTTAVGARWHGGSTQRQGCPPPGHRARGISTTGDCPESNNEEGAEGEYGPGGRGLDRRRRHDENVPPPPAPPPPPRRRPSSSSASLSSRAARQNLARAARRSKVGTKADPVTLYRQRQEELERAGAKTAAGSAAARSRKKASREGRASSAGRLSALGVSCRAVGAGSGTTRGDGLVSAWGSGTAGAGTAGGAAVRGGGARAVCAPVRRAGMCLR